MALIDVEKQREVILNIVRLYGTRTQGEEYRQEQVSQMIMELVLHIVRVAEVLDHREANDEHIVHFYVSR